MGGVRAPVRRFEVVTQIAQVRARVAEWRDRKERVVFVPTMGNLHAGHTSLLEVGRLRGDRLIASIFVNPMQFGPNEDFAHYPRTPTADEQLLAAAGCDLMFMPAVEEMYPNGAADATRVEVPGLSQILCGAFRPGHFEGVATVVAKLFNIVAPDAAVFGEKDWQQLTVIRRMVADLCMPIDIIGAPTVREADGLAMSSRNQYLSPEERRLAPLIHAVLEEAVRRLREGERAYGAIEEAAASRLANAGMRPDYFAIRDSVSLQVPDAGTREFAVLTAVRLGKARLIDNLRTSARN